MSSSCTANVLRLFLFFLHNPLSTFWNRESWQPYSDGDLQNLIGKVSFTYMKVFLISHFCCAISLPNTFYRTDQLYSTKDPGARIVEISIFQKNEYLRSNWSYPNHRTINFKVIWSSLGKFLSVVYKVIDGSLLSSR